MKRSRCGASPPTTIAREGLFHQVQSILDDVRSSGLIEETARALLFFSEKMTREPAKVAAEEVEELRKIGLSHAAILEDVQVISFFNYLDRMADALGWSCPVSFSPPSGEKSEMEELAASMHREVAELRPW